LGILAASSQGRWPDQFERFFSLSIVSLPVFWIALMAQLTLGYALGLLPTGGRYDILASPPPPVTRLYLIDSLLAGDPQAFGISLQHIILPALCLSLAALSSITRMTRAAVLDVLHKDYVRLGRANGIPEVIILSKYVLKNALTAILTIVGLSFGWMLAGSVLVETVFDWPGIGLYTTKSILYLDFMPIMGVTLLSGVAFFTVNLIVDVLYGVVDPRVRRG
jgi:peptide/nickel transport system permease protein